MVKVVARYRIPRRLKEMEEQIMKNMRCWPSSEPVISHIPCTWDELIEKGILTPEEANRMMLNGIKYNHIAIVREDDYVIIYDFSPDLGKK